MDKIDPYRYPPLYGDPIPNSTAVLPCSKCKGTDIEKRIHTYLSYGVSAVLECKYCGHKCSARDKLLSATAIKEAEEKWNGEARS